MVLGFATTGTLEETYLFSKLPAEATGPSLNRQNLFEQAPDLIASIERLPFDEETHCLWHSCEEEERNGFGGPLVVQEVMDARFGRGKWSPIPTCVAKQPNGKKRWIDFGRKGGQNAAAAYPEKLRMVSPV